MRTREDAGIDDGRDETANERADRNWSDILQELRVTLTGIQLISGFLLAVAFQSRFTELDRYQLTLYLVLVALAAAAALFGLAPVLMHRTHFQHHRKQQVVRVGNRFLLAELVIVILLTAGVCSLIFDFAAGRIAGIVALVIALAFAAGLACIARPRGPGAGAA